MRRRKYRRYKQPVQFKKIFKNKEIIFNTIRVIDQQGKQLGVMSREEAITKAEESEVDLVLVTAKADPPICKMINYGKYLFQQTKKQSKKINKDNTKEVRLSFGISDHDMETKAQRSKLFLEGNNKVKINIVLRGRENSFQDLAKNKINKFVEKIKEKIAIKTETDFKKEPKGYSIIVSKK